MKLILIIIGFACCTLLALPGCNTNAQAPAVAATNKDSVEIAAFLFKTTQGWGYGININNRLFIKQNCIPAIPGNKSFTTKDDATKCAALVIDKIKQHEKPAISKEDLGHLGISVQ